MLRVTQSNSAARAKSYYSTADYYTEGQELVGLWRGRGAERLNLTGRIDRDDWDLLCDNLQPETGEPLTVRRRIERRVGYDFNFHCPKSVSLLYGLTQDERILQAFRESVDATMEDIEDESKARVRRGGKNEDRGTGNLIWGEFVHFTARPEDGVPDPHLHAHCFVFNGTFDQAEDRWKAAQLGDIKRDAPYFEAVFHSRLARRLEELGLDTQRTAKGWELKGIATETLDKFSRRTKRIEKLAKERGITNPDAKAELGAQTRSGKAKELTMPELDGLWRSRMTEQEAAGLDGLLRRMGRESIGEDDRAAVDAVERAVVHSFERSSVLPERTLLAEALRQGVGKASRETIERLAESQPLIRATREGRRLVTTEEVLQEESRMLAFARSGRGTCRPINPNARTVLDERLNAQQRAAVRHVLESRDRVTLIRGAAGVGKTTMMQEARAAIEETGLHVFAFAPSAGASRGVLRTDGFESADTVARLLLDQKLQAEVEGGVIWIDEAGLLGTKTMREVFDVAGRHHARVVLSGDRRQHGSVERGAALRLLEDEAGLKPAEIKEIQRQRDQYKQAVKALSDGDVSEGLRRLDTLGWVRELPEEGRNHELAKAYVGSLKSGKTALVISPTHAEADAITSAIRHELREQNLLGKEERQLAQLVPANLTLGQRLDPTSYQPGDVLVFHQNAKGYKRGQRLIAGRDSVPFDQAARFTVFHQRTLGVSVGDRVRITRNGKSAGGQRLDNGDVYAVKSFAADGDLVLENGWKLSKDYGHLTHGVVLTSHASQGKTVDRVFIGQSAQSFPASSREQFYVSASRGREQVMVFTDDKAELLHAIGRTDDRLSGTELVECIDPIRRHAIREQLKLQETAQTPGDTRHGPEREAIDYDR
jgi:conjugative relaxase-like TrwC/TraI family protein